MSATAISEVSLDPPSMLVCVNAAASLYPLLEQGHPFGINILHHSQRNIADRCGGGARGEDRFLEGEWGSGSLDVPYLAGAQARIICRNVKAIRHGTHGVFIGEVVEVGVDGIAEPLIYLDGRYTNASLALPQGASVIRT